MGTDRDTIQQLAIAEPNVKKFIMDCSIQKIIVVPDRLVNIVVA